MFREYFVRVRVFPKDLRNLLLRDNKPEKSSWKLYDWVHMTFGVARSGVDTPWLIAKSHALLCFKCFVYVPLAARFDGQAYHWKSF